ncbi:uncharacterized protein PRCAT00001345001 [Priceomyces carsonii]|uniref:uncharacterized protein n=1 Tax=Priceomyces carsonii TaxID=28549 RepID=UPI002ED9F8A9|nr:unnamed protein product [Priceomyces carsonii]
MSKREAEEAGSQLEKKVKADGKKDEIAIDSELLGQQLSYGGQHNDQNNAATAAAAVAAAAASSNEPANAAAALNSQQHQHQQQQLQQHLAYQNAFRQQVVPSQQSPQSQSPSLDQHSPGLSHVQPTGMPKSSGMSKPQHGSDEWHRQRRENHKEVERRRRESINQGIKELAALIPTNDTNKSQILQRGVEYIKRLKENESNNIEKWTLEKLLTEQAVSELSASNEKLKQELERAYREIEQWKKVAKDLEKK